MKLERGMKLSPTSEMVDELKNRSTTGIEGWQESDIEKWQNADYLELGSESFASDCHYILLDNHNGRSYSMTALPDAIITKMRQAYLVQL